MEISLLNNYSSDRREEITFFVDAKLKVSHYLGINKVFIILR